MPEGTRRAARGARLLVVGLLVALVTGDLSAGERWGWLGVRIRDLSETEMEDLSIKFGITEGYGVMIAEVIADTPAEAAGLRSGDLVVAIEERPVVETRALQRWVGGTPPGARLRLVVLREGERREIHARVAEMPGDVVAERVMAEFGFFVRQGAERDLPSVDREDLRPSVVAVAEESAAARGGVEVGDEILAVDGRAVATLEAVRATMRAVLLGNELRLRVRRRGEPLSLVLPPARGGLPAQ